MLSVRAPVISVLLPVHNGGVYLAVAVESILRQSFSDFEFLIINDGSTDASMDVLRHYERADTRIRLVEQRNKGLISTLNRGIQLARGEFVARMDADDVSEPLRFAAQLEFLRREKDCVVVGSSLLLIDADGDPLRREPMPCSHDAIDEQLLLGKGTLPHPAAMIRRDALVAAGGYRSEYPCAEDLDLWLRMAEMGRLANLPAMLLRYRIHDDSVSVRKRRLQLDSARRAVGDAQVRRGQQVTNLQMPQPPSARASKKPPRNLARMALREGYLATGKKHAWSAVRAAPLSPSNLGMLLELGRAVLIRRSPQGDAT